MSVTSDEINLLVQNYFQEMGYNHSAFSFAAESKVISKEISSSYVPPGSLVYLLQKGVLSTQIETGADNALHRRDSSFQLEVLTLRDNLQQSLQSIEDRASATRRTNVFNLSESNDTQHIFLSEDSSFILKSHESPITTIKFSPNSKYLAVGGQDGVLVLWEFYLDSKEKVIIYDDPKSILLQKDNTIPTDITCLCWSDSSDLLAIGFLCGLIIVYSQNSIVFRNSDNQSSAVAMEFQKEVLLVGNFDGTVRIIANGHVVKTFILPSTELSDVKWTEQFPVSSAGNTIYSLAESPKPLCKTRKNIIQMAVDPRKVLVAASDLNGFVAIFGTIDKRNACEQIHISSTTGITWSTNSQLYLTCDIEGEIKIVDIQEAQPNSVKGHTGPIVSLAFDPRGKYFVSAGVDRKINCWASRTNRQEFCFESYEDTTCIDCSADGRFLVFGMKDGTNAILDFQLLI
jgi:WD40 repeat protein